jgi:hypothetical protein
VPLALLRHHVQARRQDAAPGSGISCTCAESGTPPQVDGDVVSLTIANIRLYHILIDGGAALNLMSLAAFQKLQIPMSRLSPSRPFSGVSPGSIIPRSSISLLVTFGTPENYRTKSVVFDAAVNLPFNTIIGRPVGYLVLKMSSPNDISKIRAGEAPGAGGSLVGCRWPRGARSDTIKLTPARLIFCTCVQPSDNEDIPVKIIQISADVA